MGATCSCSGDKLEQENEVKVDLHTHSSVAYVRIIFFQKLEIKSKKIDI